MSIIKKGKRCFKPRARLLVLLGEQLITNEVIAVVELVKNAYDADATRVNVVLEDSSQPEKGRIVVKDNGLGMSLDTILNVWLEPATDFRQKQREQQKRTGKGRHPLGEKGVGRFAAHKLGNIVELVTRELHSREEVVVKVNWEEFEKGGYLEDIPVTWVTRLPEVFRGKDHGTMITVEALRKTWTARMVRDVFVKVQALNSPFTERSDFAVSVNAPEFAETLEDLPELPDILNRAVYSMDGRVDENGILHYSYRFNNPAFPKIRRELGGKVQDAREPRAFQGGRKPLCGAFRIRFYVWDLDPASLGETIQRAYYNHYVKPHMGIRIYRDDFRVWPYGEPDDDSFGLDARRVNNPTKCLSRNQVIGLVEVTYSDNPQLRDKTDREGLILNEQYEDFRELIIGCLSILEVERRKDKNAVGVLREKKKPKDSVHTAIDDMQSKMEKKDHFKIYRDDVRKVRASYDKRVKEILEPLYVSAGLGIAYMLPVHELTRNLGDMEQLLNVVLEDMKKSGGKKTVVENLKKVIQTTDVVDDLVRGVGKLSRRGKKETVILASVVKDALDIVRPRFKKDEIETDYAEKSKVKVKGVKNMLVTALLNLLDNSSYWLLRRELDRRVIIRVDRDADGKPRLTVSDNGPGIEDEPSLLVQPFYSRKPDGSGIGLYIVDRIMKEAHHGELQFLDRKHEKGLLEGANIALVFPEEKEAKK